MVKRITCPDCHGAGETYFQSRIHPGFVSSSDCDRCDCTGEVDFDLSCLSHNLAIGAALCAAFELGNKWGQERLVATWNGGGWTYPWEPGCRRPILEGER